MIPPVLPSDAELLPLVAEVGLGKEADVIVFMLVFGLVLNEAITEISKGMLVVAWGSSVRA